MKLLIVDDSGFARRKFREAILKQEPSLQIVEAVDGVDALQKIESEAPDVCVTDLLMPKMDGLEFLRAMKERVPTTKVIVLSADIQDSRKEACYELGAALFLEKPLSAAKLSQILVNLAQ
jgi:DNA-binding NarL/FixJ family response regulator